MQRSTSKGGKYFQSMEKQSDTLNGKFSTLKDTFQNKLGGAFQGVTDFLRDSAIPVAIDMLENWEKYEPIFVTLGIIVGALTLAYAANTLGITTLTGATGVWATVSGLASGATTALGAAFTFLTTPIGGIILAVGAVIAIGYLLIKNWEEVKAFGIKTWNGITTFINDKFISKWKAGWNAVKTVFGNIFGGIVNIAKKPINGVIGLVNKAIGGLNKLSVSIPSWVPIVGGQKWGVNIPRIPYLLHGTDNWQGGLAYMNEGGRGELVNLPNGSQVIPHDISVKYAQEAARINTFAKPIEINLEGVVIDIDITTEIDTMPIKKKTYEYTLRRMDNKYKAELKGSGA
jgi:phage-related protein